jgi:tetratricopeptide (TPR) repeat protein
MKTLEQHSLVERLAQAAYGLAFYPAKTMAPLSLAPFYSLPDEIDPFAPRFLLPIVGVVFTTVALVRLRRRLPVGLAAWVAYAILISPVLGLLQSGPQLVAERYSYLACLPFALLAGGAVTARTRTRGRGRTLALAAGMVAVVALGTLTWRQSSHWTSSRALWEHASRVRPAHSVGWMYRATLKSEEAMAISDLGGRASRLEEARAILEEGRTRSNDPKLLGTLASVHSALAAADTSRAAEHRRRAVDYSRDAFRSSVERGEFRPLYQLDYGKHLTAGGRPGEALEHLNSYVERFPNRLEGRIALARALVETGDGRNAVVHLELAANKAPDQAELWRLFGRAHEIEGNWAEAIWAWQRVVALAPRDEAARAHLRDLLRR